MIAKADPYKTSLAKLTMAENNNIYNQLERKGNDNESENSHINKG